VAQCYSTCLTCASTWVLDPTCERARERRKEEEKERGEGRRGGDYVKELKRDVGRGFKKSNRSGEFDPNILCACIEILQ
jgi:hypothetical protein